MQIPAGFAQVNYIFSGEGYKRGAQVVVGCENDTDLSAEAVALKADQHFKSTILPLLSAEIQLASVKAKLGPNETGAEWIRVDPEDGQVVGAGLPPNVALLITKRTNLGGRKHRGRMFIPGLSESDTDTAGYVVTAKLNAFGDAITDYLEIMATDNLALHLLHNDGTAPTPIVALVPQALMATQKRRIRRAGGRRSPVVA